MAFWKVPKSGQCFFLLLFKQLATQLVQLPIYCCRDDQEATLAKLVLTQSRAFISETDKVARWTLYGVSNLFPHFNLCIVS